MRHLDTAIFVSPAPNFMPPKSNVLYIMYQIVELKLFDFISLQQGNVGMTGPLIDSEGYPRNDIDVYSVRTARHNIICKYKCMHTAIYSLHVNTM